MRFLGESSISSKKEGKYFKLINEWRCHGYRKDKNNRQEIDPQETGS
jgi:hypothetical protein